VARRRAGERPHRQPPRRATWAPTIENGGDICSRKPVPGPGRPGTGGVREPAAPPRSSVRCAR